MIRRSACAPALLIGVAACAPALRPVPPQAAVSAPQAWRDPQSSGVLLDAGWWRGFGDPALVPLVERALAYNTDVLTALARIDEAEATIRQTRAARLPTLDASGSGGAQRSLGSTTGTNAASAQAQASAAWALDLSGRVRALEGAARAAYVASQADRDAMQLTVISATVRGYVSLLSLDEQVAAARRTLESRRDALRIAADRAEVGYSSRFELTQAQAEYENVLQTIPQLELARRTQENSLRELVGELPGVVTRGSFSQLRPPTPPAAIPSTLMRRRPDLASAELAIVAADRTLAARRAQFLPDVQLSASGGALLIDSLQWNPVTVWSLGASLFAPIFQGGALTAQVDVATAQRDQAAYAYRAAVLRAFGEVENALTGEQRYREQIDTIVRRRTILQQSVMLATDRYRGGYAAYIEVLDAQRNLYQSDLAAISVREQQLNNLVQLWAALGGGWEAPAN